MFDKSLFVYIVCTVTVYYYYCLLSFASNRAQAGAILMFHRVFSSSSDVDTKT